MGPIRPAAAPGYHLLHDTRSSHSISTVLVAALLHIPVEILLNERVNVFTGAPAHKRTPQHIGNATMQSACV